MERLTEQLEKLSINLAQKQTTTSTPQPVYYTDDSSNRNQSNNNTSSNITCYYCGNKGYFVEIAKSEKIILNLEITDQEFQKEQRSLDQ